jgi:hypothetical protein
VNGGIEGEIAACKTLVVLLSDFEQPTENKVSKILALSNSVLVNDREILIILFFNIGVALGKVEPKAIFTS